MSQASAKTLHEPVINKSLLNYLYHRSGKTIEALSEETGLSIATISRALNAICTNVFTYAVVGRSLGSALKFITDTELPESQYHCAVINGGSAVSDRSAGSAGRSTTSKKPKSAKAA